MAIRRSRCEGEARGNLKSSFAPLRTWLRRFTPRNDTLLNVFALNIFALASFPVELLNISFPLQFLKDRFGLIQTIKYQGCRDGRS